MSENYGQWQAQGDDITTPPKGHCVEWGQDTVPTKRQGRCWLDQVYDMCTKSQRRRRERTSFADARRFLKRAPPEGYPSMLKPFYAGCDNYSDARVDVEIYGKAFCDPEETP